MDCGVNVVGPLSPLRSMPDVSILSVIETGSISAFALKMLLPKRSLHAIRAVKCLHSVVGRSQLILGSVYYGRAEDENIAIKAVSSLFCQRMI